MADLKVYTLDVVADILKVTKRTLYNYIKAGELPAIKMGKYWRVTQENLQSFVSKDTPVIERTKHN